MVLCTHLHVDHVGWNTRLENGRWVPTFPNARYLIARREWEYWRAAGPAAFAFTGDYISDSVLPIFKSGQVDLICDGGGGQEAILCSDLMHHPLQVRYPTWSTRFCVDPDQARRTLEARNLAYNNVEHVGADNARKKSEGWAAASKTLREQRSQHLNLAYGNGERNSGRIRRRHASFTSTAAIGSAAAGRSSPAFPRVR